MATGWAPRNPGASYSLFYEGQPCGGLEPRVKIRRVTHREKGLKYWGDETEIKSACRRCTLEVTWGETKRWRFTQALHASFLFLRLLFDLTHSP